MNLHNIWGYTRINNVYGFKSVASFCHPQYLLRTSPRSIPCVWNSRISHFHLNNTLLPRRNVWNLVLATWRPESTKLTFQFRRFLARTFRPAVVNRQILRGVHPHKELRALTQFFFLRNAITSVRQFASQNHEIFVYFTISNGSVFISPVTYPPHPSPTNWAHMFANHACLLASSDISLPYTKIFFLSARKNRHFEPMWVDQHPQGGNYGNGRGMGVQGNAMIPLSTPGINSGRYGVAHPCKFRENWIYINTLCTLVKDFQVKALHVESYPRDSKRVFGGQRCVKRRFLRTLGDVGVSNDVFR